MSEENVESARRAVEIYNTHDVAALQVITTNDVEFRTFLEGRAEAEPLRGHEEALKSGSGASRRPGRA